MTTTISIRTSLALKNKAAKIFEARGLNMSTAFNMYLSDVVEGKTVPTSDARYVPKKIMEKWESWKKDALKEGKYFNNIDDLMKDLRS